MKSVKILKTVLALGVCVGAVATLYFVKVKPDMERVDAFNRSLHGSRSYAAVSDLSSFLYTSSRSEYDHTQREPGAVDDYLLLEIHKRCNTVKQIAERIGDDNVPAYQALLKQTIATCADIGSKLQDNQLSYVFLRETSNRLRAASSAAFDAVNAEQMKRDDAQREAELKNAKNTVTEMSSWKKEQ